MKPWFYAIIVITTGLVSCKKDEKKKSTLNASLRSSGAEDLSLAASRLGLFALGTSTVEVESLKVPIGRINLYYGDTGSGYTDSSPAFYTCDKKNEECEIDLLKTDVNDLLTAGADTGEVVFAEEKTYEGVSVEICSDADDSKTFELKLKASATLAGTTYYTNPDGEGKVSLEGPAKEIGIQMECMGRNTDLLEPVTIKPEDTVDLALWTDPTGAVFFVDDMSAHEDICADTSGAGFCSSLPMIFGTLDSKKPTIERHLLDVTSLGENNIPYTDVVVTTLYDSKNEPFGASAVQYFPDQNASSFLGSDGVIHMSKITATSTTLKLEYMTSNSGSYTVFASDIPREGTGQITVTGPSNDELRATSTRL